jgi:hypothetical protein
MIALACPAELWLMGEDAQSASIARDVYKAAGATGELVIYDGPPTTKDAAAIQWLVAR